MALKRDKLDKVISDLIRCRAGWHCERCKKYYPKGHRGGLECSHYYGRRGLSTRWHPPNLSSFCTGCHFHMGGAQDEYTAFMRKELGDTGFEELVLPGNAVRKYTKSDREELYQHYKAQWNYMCRLRKEGRMDWLEFVAWD